MQPFRSVAQSPLSSMGTSSSSAALTKGAAEGIHKEPTTCAPPSHSEGAPHTHTNPARPKPE
eukprot:2315857-Amphidinium_carterae.1